MEQVSLWDPEYPQMYIARTVVEPMDGPKDVYETPFAFRQAENMQFHIF